MEKRTGKRIKASKKKRPNKRKKTVLAIAAFSVIIIFVLASYSVSAKNKVREWEDRIYPGVTVQGVDVGGMTKDEAQNKLTDTFEKAIYDKKLSIAIGNKQYELIYSDIIPKYDIDGTVEQAYNFGKENGILKKYMAIKSGESKKSEIPIKFSYDEEKLKEYEEKLQKEANQAPKDATIIIEGKNITVKPEVEGRTIDLETLDKELKENINGEIDSSDTVTIDVETTKPKVTQEDLSKIKGVMGTFSTDYSSSAPGRCNNIELATKAIDGTVIMPGEVFSFNEIVGPRTAERGYKEAGTFVGNKVEPGIGGGICQVSTTLYRAAMHANLRPVERRNHSMTVGYAKPGLDATVSYGTLDYKFKNTYDFPIFIKGNTGGKVVAYSIYGDPSALDGKIYDMENEILETIPPGTKSVDDNTLPEGKEVNEGGGITGYKVKSYQITYEKNVEVNRELISTDTYASVDATVRKGTQKPDTKPADAASGQSAPPAQTPPTTQGQAPAAPPATPVN